MDKKISCYFVTLVLLLVSANVCRGINYRPYFTQPNLVKTIPENVEPGYFIADVSGYTVDDESDIITYGLDSYGSQICNIGPKTGRLTLKKPLDREVQAQFKIIVSAQDSHQGGGQHRTAMLPVFLYVLDANDNAPVFLNTPYLATVSENATIGTTILTVKAYDIDDGRNALVGYSLKPTKGVAKFAIDGDSGAITVASELDYEKEKKYTLVVIAKDKGTPQNLESRTTIVIDVTDVRDSNPRFLQSSYQTQLDENRPLGSAVIKVTAVDGDTSINHPIRYSIIGGNDEGMFKIDEQTGVIKVNGTLDRERTNIFKLQVKAWELPDESAFVVVGVIILINDVNDNKPSFTKSHYTFRVKENVPHGFVLAEQFSAVDADIEKKHNRFEYSIQGGEGKFAINPYSGRLQVSGELDYEKRRNYTFRVLAKESETKERFIGSTNVTVEVINANDNAPIFERLVYVFTAFENISTEKAVGHVKAHDKDEGSFGDVSYEIKSNRIGSPMFSINSQTGKIYAARPLDYSKADVHHFVVLAKDKGGESSRQSRTLVQVLVIEVKRPTTRILTTIKASTTRAPTTRTLENSISETRRRTVIEQDVERTKSASARTVCFQSIALLFITLILSLRALVT
eukprot:Seg3075.2 transcript_id=Seg3075.2/GoldUCD/mRNA.D3Y31 product=Cadherin-23 protein_id=Seg3075.2/GoldUCD/D3Y31